MQLSTNIKWPVRGEVHRGKATPSPAGVARLANEDIFDVTRVSRNGQLLARWEKISMPSGLLTLGGSRNCTKHNCRCDYMDNPPAGDVAKSSEGPNLLWNSTIEREVKTWQATGIFPFAELNLQSCGQFRDLSTIDLRLIHHISSIYRDMQPANLGNCTLWVEQIPKYGSGPSWSPMCVVSGS